MTYLLNKRVLTLSEVVELALACEIPIKTPITLLEICIHIWEVQSRPCYKQRLSSVHEIHLEVIEYSRRNPEKLREILPETYVSHFY